MSENTAPVVGRNEPCPCGSGHKYKRCCGVGAAPKITPPAAFNAPTGGAPGAGPAGDPAELLKQMDPAMMSQITQALSRLPRSQVQRLQSIMQRAMAGKDVAQEAAAFEKTLPLEFQTLMRGVSGGLMGGPGMVEEPASPAGEMTEEEARRIVEAAAQKGQVSGDVAADLLSTPPGEKSSGMSKFFGKFGKK